MSNRAKYLRNKNLRVVKPQIQDDIEQMVEARIRAEKLLEEQRAKEAQHVDDMKIINELVGELKNLRGMVEGLTEMTRFAADQLDQFKKVVQILEQSLRSPSQEDYSEYADDTPEGVERSRNDRVRQMMSHGLTEKEARARIGERDIYTEMAKNRR